MVRLTWDGFRTQDTAPLSLTETLCRDARERESAFAEHLEHIGQDAHFLAGAIRAIIEEGVPLTDRAVREINSLFEKAVELTECVRDAVLTDNRVLIRHVIEHGRQFGELANDYAHAHQQRLSEGVCVPRASSVYLAVLDHLKGIAWQARQIAQALASARER